MDYRKLAALFQSSEEILALLSGVKRCSSWPACIHKVQHNDEDGTKATTRPLAQHTACGRACRYKLLKLADRSRVLVINARGDPHACGGGERLSHIAPPQRASSWSSFALDVTLSARQAGCRRMAILAPSGSQTIKRSLPLHKNRRPFSYSSAHPPPSQRRFLPPSPFTPTPHDTPRTRSLPP
jgi:hypothetical protein